jgi:hypothetical protein
VGIRVPDVTQTEIGRRLYHVHRDKRVENAIKKLRDHCGSHWKSLTEQEIRDLEYVLSGIWTSLDEKTWERIPFASLTKEDVSNLLRLAKGADLSKGIDAAVLEEAKKIVLKVK